MAGMLRSARIQEIYKISRNSTTVNYIKKNSPSSLAVSSTFRDISIRNYATSKPNVQQMEKRAMVDQALYRMDTNVRRTGRVNRSDVLKVFNSVKSLGATTPMQSLLLIRCCGSLLAQDHPDKRSELINQFWTLLKEQDSKIDVSHFNALLKVHLENSYNFSTSDILAEMESSQVEPNRVTYQRLIEKHCQAGDMEGAGNILQIMKDKQMPVNELVFNSLVLGHSRSNDMEGAKNILEVMRNAKLEPSSDTYASLLCGYAEKGNINSIRETLADLEKAQIQLTTANYFSIVHSLTQFGYSQYIDEMMNKCPKSAGFNQDSINNILDLMNHGYIDAAYKLLGMMPHSKVSENDVQPPNGQFFIRQLVLLNRPADEIQSYCTKMKNDGINEYALSKATEFAYMNSNPALGIELVQKLIESGLDARPHYFWPAFVEAHNKNDVNAVHNILKMMVQAKCVVTHDTLVDYVLPALDSSDPKSMTQLLKDITQTTITNVVNPIVTFLLNEKRLQEAYEVVQSYPAGLNGSNLLNNLASFTTNEENYDYIIKILGHVREIPGARERNDWIGNFLLNALYFNYFDLNKLEPLVNKMNEKNMKISQNNLELLLNKTNTDVSPQLNEVLELLVSIDIDPVHEDLDSSIPHPKDMSLDELETHYIELKNKNMNTRGILRKLLLHHCRFKNLSRVQELLADAEKNQQELTSSVYSSLMDLYTHYDNLEDALACKKILDEKDPLFSIDSYKILNLARVMAQHGQIDDIVKLIEKHSSNNMFQSNNMSIQRNIFRVLNVTAEKGDPESTNKLFEALDKSGLCIKTNLTLGPLVKAYIFKNDLDGAIKKFEECCSQYENTPWKNEILVQLIKKEDTENIKKVMDLSSEIHGEMNILYDLAFAFNNCGKLNQAKKILETPGLRAKLTRLDPMCERYLSMNMVTELESLLKITRDLFGVNRDRMYFYLLRAYCKENNVDKALSIWTSMQEENVQPSAKTLNFLANFLKKHDKPIPFALPEEVVVSEKSNWLELKDSIRINNLDQALDIKRMNEVSGNNLGPGLSSSLLQALVSNSRINDARGLVHEMLSNNMYPYPRVFRQFAAHFANAGDFAYLEELNEKMPDVLIRASSFNSFIFNAYINSGNYMQALDNLKNNLDKYRDSYFPLSSMVNLLKKHPESEAEVLEIAKNMASQHNDSRPLNMVWISYFSSKQYEKASNILNEYPALNDSLVFMAVIDELKTNGDIDMAKKLIEVVNSTSIEESKKTNAISGLIYALVKNGKTDDALAEFDSAIERGCNKSHFIPHVLQTLKTALQNEGKEVTFTIPVRVVRDRRNTRPRNDDLSSDSSDSSSDDEK